MFLATLMQRVLASGFIVAILLAWGSAGVPCRRPTGDPPRGFAPVHSLSSFQLQARGADPASLLETEATPIDGFDDDERWKVLKPCQATARGIPPDADLFSSPPGGPRPLPTTLGEPRTSRLRC